MNEIIKPDQDGQEPSFKFIDFDNLNVVLYQMSVNEDGPNQIKEVLRTNNPIFLEWLSDTFNKKIYALELYKNLPENIEASKLSKYYNIIKELEEGEPGAKYIMPNTMYLIQDSKDPICDLWEMLGANYLELSYKIGDERIEFWDRNESDPEETYGEPDLSDITKYYLTRKELLKEHKIGDLETFQEIDEQNKANVKPFIKTIDKDLTSIGFYEYGDQLIGNWGDPIIVYWEQ